MTPITKEIECDTIELQQGKMKQYRHHCVKRIAPKLYFKNMPNVNNEVTSTQ